MMSDLLLRLCRFSELTSKPTSFFPICRDGLFSQRDQTRFLHHGWGLFSLGRGYGGADGRS